MPHFFPRWSRVLLLLVLPLAAQAQNVGVGTTQPTQKLDVNGNLRVRDLSGTDTRLLQADAAGNLSPAATAYPASVGIAPALASTTTGLNNPLVAVSGTLAVVLNRGAGTLSLYDVSNPTALVLRGTATGISSGVEVAISGSTAAVLCNVSTGYVQLYALGSGAPALVNTLTPPASSSGLYSGIAMTGNLLYAAYDRGGAYGYLYVYDVSTPATTNLLNPAAPCTTCATGNTGYFTPQTVAAAGNFVAVGHAYSGAALLDVSNPAAIARTGLVGGTTSGGYNGRDEPVALTTTTLCTLNPATAELATYNVSTAGALSLRHFYTTGTNPVSVALNGSLAYVACQGSNALQVIDVSGTSAVLRGTVALDASANNVAVTSTLVLAANASAANDLQVFTQPTRTVVVNPDGTAGSAPTPSGATFIQNQTATVQTAGFNINGNGTIGGNVSIGTSSAPTSTLQVAGTNAVGVVMGLAGNSSGTPLAGGGYLGLSPTSGADYYLLPNAASCVGRVYYLRNNSSSNIAYVGASGGLIFEGGTTAAATQPYFMQPSGLTKTVTAISDGTNWTLLKNGN